MKGSFVSLPVFLLYEPRTILLLDELSMMEAISEATKKASGIQRTHMLKRKGSRIAKKAHHLFDIWVKELFEKGYVIVTIRRLMN